MLGRLLFLAGLMLISLGTGLAGEVSFSAPPSASRNAEGTVVSFSASGPSDVEVAILDAAGRVVRHLAAGMLGKSAPEPLKADSLRQAVVWDGKDDLGKPATGGPFKARVRLGMRPKFESMIGAHPAALGSVRGLAAGPGGELFVFHVIGWIHSGDGTTQCSVFSRDGKYLRTILPYPANLPADKLKGLKRIELEDGRIVPFIYQVECREFVPGTGDLPALGPVVTADGRVAFSGILDAPTRYAQPGALQTMVVGADGSVPESGLMSARIAAWSSKCAFLALSPDGKTIYATGMNSEAKKPAPHDHVVLKFGWQDKEPQVFAGAAGQSGADDKHLNNPSDVAVGKDGLVYVADRNNDRVLVFKPDGSVAATMKMDKPCRIKVHPKTNVIYALCGPGMNVLQKYASYKDAAPGSSLTIGTFKHPEYTAVMALDASTEPPVLWFGAPKGHYSGFTLLRVEDKGSEFGKPVDIGKAAAGGIGSVSSVEYDRVRGALMVNSYLHDAATGAWKAPHTLSNGYPLSVGLDGNYYTQVYGNYLLRFGPDLKPMPFATSSQKNGGIQDAGTSARSRGRGITADSAGNIYVIWQEDYAPRPPVNHVHVHAPDGSVKKQKLFDSEIRSLNSIRVDFKGNVYLALGLRPGTERLPKGLQGKVPDVKNDADAVGGINGYPMMYGSIAKFGPEGGVIRKGSGGVRCNFAFANETEVKGAKWIYSGASPVPSWRTAGTTDICLCESPRFDVNGFGRSFFPDAGRFRVGVLDTNGNEICFFGSYGNSDSAGPGSQIPAPEIPLCWPYAIAAGDGVVFVGDRLNRRVVRVKLEYAAEKVLSLP